MSEALKKVALKNILVGKTKDNFELWESDKMPFEELLRRVKDQARAKKLEKDAQRGRSGISLGMSQSNGHRKGQEYETWGEPVNSQTNGGEDPQELNSTQTRKFPWPGRWATIKVKLSSRLNHGLTVQLFQKRRKVL